METKYEVKTIKVQVKLKEGKIPAVTSPGAVAELAKHIYKDLDADQEHFVILALNTQNEVDGYKVIASGMMDQVNVDMKIVFRSALLLGATGLILVHNHPSGYTEPSEDDKRLTKATQEAAKLLNIRLLDHIILSHKGHYSFLEHRLI